MSTDTTSPLPRFTAFEGDKRIGQGPLASVAQAVKQRFDLQTSNPLFVFQDSDGSLLELDLRGTESDVLRRLPPLAATPSAQAADAAEPDTTPADTPRRPGRPRLGVVAREVTLLPRHWEWLNQQPGGASVALRKLVDGARHQLSERQQARAGQERSYRFMHAMAGDAPGFEAASRALFAGDEAALRQAMANWPEDVRDYALTLATGAFAVQDNPTPTP